MTAKSDNTPYDDKAVKIKEVRKCHKKRPRKILTSGFLNDLTRVVHCNIIKKDI